jgi:virginiamycin B lyase
LSVAFAVVAVSSPGALASGGKITEFSKGLGAHGRPDGIAKGPDGNMWFVDGGSAAIGRITPAGKITEFHSGVGTPGTTVGQIAAGPDGNMWFTAGLCSNNRDPGGPPCVIGRITPGGKIAVFSVGAGGPFQCIPTGIAKGPDGNMWFTLARCDHGVGRITPDGTITYYGSGAEAFLMTTGAGGSLWFLGSGIATAGFDQVTTSGQIISVSQTRVGFGAVDALAAGPGGNMWFTVDKYPAHFAIGRITPSGTITQFSQGFTARDTLAGIAKGPDGNMWFTDQESKPAIGQVTSGGKITKSRLKAGSRPYYIAAGAHGVMWFTDGGRHPAIGRIAG